MPVLLHLPSKQPTPQGKVELSKFQEAHELSPEQRCVQLLSIHNHQQYTDYKKDNEAYIFTHRKVKISLKDRGLGFFKTILVEN